MVVSAWVGGVSVSPVAAGQEKVTVCHKPGTEAEATLEIAAPAEAAHLAHGDTPGECTGPQSAGCAALNAVVPDPQTGSNFYYFGVTGLDFFPGETIHVDMTVTNDATIPGSIVQLVVGPVDSNEQFLVYEFIVLDSGEQGTASVDYVVVSGDDADGALAVASASVGIPFTLDSVNFSCTPAP